MNYDRNDPTAEENRAPKFCVGDRVRTQHGPEMTVLTVHGDRAWCDSPLWGPTTYNFGELTLVPDTVLVEMPRDLRDRIAAGYFDTIPSARSALTKACRKSKEQDQ